MINNVVNLFVSGFSCPIWAHIVPFACFVCVVGIVLKGVGKRV